MVEESLPSEKEVALEKIRLIHAGHSPAQADIWLVEFRGHPCVLRDYSKPRPWIFRRLCRWAARREIRAHRMLEGVDGIPALIEILDADRYLMDYIEGDSLAARFKNPPPPEFFHSLGQILFEMHAKRVAHGDLRNKNILVDREGNPHVIDFSTAWWGTALWRKPLFRFYRRLDDRRLAKSKAKFAPETLTDTEKKLLASNPWYHKIGALYRKGIYPRIRSKRNETDAS